MPLSPTLTGSITVDNTQTDLAALVSFSLTTGSKTWTQAEFVGTVVKTITFNGVGDLESFGLYGFESGAGFMYIFSDNTFGVGDDSLVRNACNNCVSFALAATAVPEPASLTLFGIGLASLYTARRRKTA